MRGEARGMLEGVLQELSAIPEVAVSVAASPPAASQINLSDADVQEVSAPGADLTVEALLQLSEEYDAVIPIAPESDGMLTRTVGSLRAAGRRVLAPSARTIAIGSDKWKTWQTLSGHGIPLVASHLPQDVTTNGDWLLKPRDGTGGEGIVPFQPGYEPARPGIVQPRLQGTSHSVSIIGTGNSAAPLVLLPADQIINWDCGQPRYHAGSVPSETINPIESQAIAVAVSKCLGHAVGYLNIDLFLSQSGGLQVMEINPRISSTYVAYRRLARFNIMEALLSAVPQLGITRTERTAWRNQTVRQNFSPPDQDQQSAAT